MPSENLHSDFQTIWKGHDPKLISPDNDFIFFSDSQFDVDLKKNQKKRSLREFEIQSIKNSWFLRKIDVFRVFFPFFNLQISDFFCFSPTIVGVVATIDRYLQKKFQSQISSESKLEHF